MPGDSDRWRVRPGTPVKLDELAADATAGAPGDEETTEATFPALWDQLAGLQERLWAAQGQKLLLVLQAMDGGGKDGTIEHVFKGVNPQGVKVTSFKAPTPSELAHDFLWRIHAATPASGEIGVFNRSHYEDVLVVRVHGLVPEPVWRGRYAHIRAFEGELVDAGTRIVKLLLHISRDEQRRRLQARIDDPAKRWKFRREDLDERKLWDDYQRAFQDAINETSTDDAPWFVIPADKKWYRNWAALRILVETLEAIDPRYPEPDDDVSSIVVE